MLIRTPPVLLAATLLTVPFANVAVLMSGPQPGKSFCFVFATLNQAKQHLNNIVLHACLGNNYKALGDWKSIIVKNITEIRDESKIHANNNLTPIYMETKEGAYCSVVLTDKFMLQKW